MRLIKSYKISLDTFYTLHAGKRQKVYANLYAKVCFEQKKVAMAPMEYLHIFKHMRVYIHMFA